eukprot:COSAG05_NODE_10380_length_568_cov_1.313433_1_plen_85_part_10
MVPAQVNWCDSLYNACKDDKFCFGTDMSWSTVPGFWSVNTSNPDGSKKKNSKGVLLGGCMDDSTGCKKFSAIYTNGTQACQYMWH